jgi:hypothetical protein
MCPTVGHVPRFLPKNFLYLEREISWPSQKRAIASTYANHIKIQLALWAIAFYEKGDRHFFYSFSAESAIRCVQQFDTQRPRINGT